MSREKLAGADYPLAENRPDLVRGRRGKSLDQVTLAAVQSGDVVMEDLRITARALQMQAEIARSSHRQKLAENFERAAELVEIPQDYLMEIYEMLRPGRAPDKSALRAVAWTLRVTYDAPLMAQFIEEAANEYDRRGLFRARF